MQNPFQPSPSGGGFFSAASEIDERKGIAHIYRLSHRWHLSVHTDDLVESVAKLYDGQYEARVQY